MRKSIGPHVSDKYFGQPLGNTQDPDEIYDKTSSKDVRVTGGMRIAGMGAQGGGSKPTPQTTRMHSGSGALHGSYPKDPQKLRG